MIGVPEAGPQGRAIRTLIVDDEPLARERIRGLLDPDPEIDVVGECGDGDRAVELIRSEKPDLVFLDIQMPGRDGFETLQALGDRIPFVVFVTSYDAYAVRAFDVHALDYLLKPYDDGRFLEALARAKTEAARRRDSAFAARVAEMLETRGNGKAPGASASGDDGGNGGAGGPTNGDGRPAPRTRENDAERGAGASPALHADGHLARIVVKRSGHVSFVEVGTIDWFEAADYYVRLHVGDAEHLVRTTMRKLERELDPARFIRIHRSTIVRIDFIRELEPWFRGEYVVVLNDGTRRSLSRSRRKKLERALGQRL